MATFFLLNSTNSLRRLTSRQSFSKRFSWNMSTEITEFFNLPHFVVVGASNDRTKFGNKVFRSYQQYKKNVTPINKRQEEIEGVKTVESLAAFANQIESKIGFPTNKIGVSIITPPGVTKLILEEGLALGYRNYFLQPGTVDESVDETITENKDKATFIKSCVLVQLGFNDNM